MREREFAALAFGLYAATHAINCDASCAHVHDGHGCDHEGHACGCPHSESYDFEFEFPEPVAEPGELLGLLVALIKSARLESLTVEQVEAAIDRWWRGENHDMRRKMEASHRRVCERGRGVLVNRVTGKVIRARCKSWRDCDYCAWVYGRSIERRVSELRALRAFAVFTMPPELGDWSNKSHIAAQARAMRRLAERLLRKFKRRFVMVWTREHNTHGDGLGRLHLNVLWDANWVDQGWLSQTAEACGFGSIVHISRVGRDALRYSTKCLRYASKDLQTQADWPKHTRRWGASRTAREQMSRPEKNPDWFWSSIEPPRVPVTKEQIGVAWAAGPREGEGVVLLDGVRAESFYVAKPRDGPTLRPLPDWLLSTP